MRIDQLIVRNFKGFADRVFDFPRSAGAAPEANGSFHLLIGENGSGKTTALDALAVAAGSWFLGIRGYDSRHIQVDDVRLVLQEFGDTIRLEKQFPVIVEATGAVSGEIITWRRSLETDGGRTTRQKAASINELADKAGDAVMKGEPVTLPLISYYGTGRLWLEPRDMRARGENGERANGSQLPPAPQDVPEEDEEGEEGVFDSRFAGYRFSIDPRCSPRDLLRWMRQEKRIAVDEGKESSQSKWVKEAIQRCTEGCRSADYNLRLRALVVDLERGGRLPFANLSDGQRNVIAMVGDLAFKAAQLNPHLGERVLEDTPGIVLVDELDLHLHPHWQRHVIEDLRRTFPQIQFIATTHSPFLVQTLRQGELIILDGVQKAEYAGRGLEEVARFVMGVDSPEMSPRYSKMMEAAKEYFQLLEEGKSANEARKAELKQRLEQLTAPYADNPAYQAFLEQKRRAAGL
jgi:predicted ATP-binding protein involved in virulence